MTTTLSETIYRTLLAEILAGQPAVGQRLPAERQLAERFDTNRNTLREAMRRLDAAGVVKARQGQGLTVQDFRRDGSLTLFGPFLQHGADPAERLRMLQDLLMLRTHVIDTAVRLAATRADEEDIATIKAITDRQRDAYRREDRHDLGHGDLDLLEALLDASHSLAVRWIANGFLGVARDVVDRFPALQVVGPAYLEWLDRLVEGIEKHDPDLAADATSAWFTEADRQLSSTLERLHVLAMGAAAGER